MVGNKSKTNKYYIYINFEKIESEATIFFSTTNMKKNLKYSFEEIILTNLIEIVWHEISYLILRYGIYDSYFAATPIKEKTEIPHCK